jgi:succinate-acetate transporter protein
MLLIVALMKLGDIVGMALFGSFGLWWALFPNATIRFYRWFHRGKVQIPSPRAIRFIGVGWFLLVVLVAIFGRPHHA